MDEQIKDKKNMPNFKNTIENFLKEIHEFILANLSK